METVIATNKKKKKTRRAKWSDGITKSPSLERLYPSVDSPKTREGYPPKLGAFFETAGLTGSLEVMANTYMQKASENGHDWVKKTVSDHVTKLKMRYLVEKNLGPNSARTDIAVLKSYFVANEDDEKGLEGVVIKWDKLTKGLPKGGNNAKDRAPTPDELRKLVEFPDFRVKSLVYVMTSTGIRIGAWEHLKWKHVTPIKNDDGQIICAKLIVYDEESYSGGLYTTFMTPEAYFALKDWMEFREREGEKITGESWLMRHLWKTTNIPRGAVRSFATKPKRWGESGIKRRLNRAWRIQGIRGILPEGKTRHDIKESHGFVKYHDTACNRAHLRPFFSELLRGHSIGLPGHYLRPTEQELLEQFLKAVPFLTINDTVDKAILQKKIVELTEKTEAVEQTNEKIERMQKQIEFLMKNAYVSEYGMQWYEKFTDQIPSEEFAKYWDEAGLLDSYPDHGKFIFEDMGQGFKEHKKYQQDVMDYGKQRRAEDFQRWLKQEREKGQKEQ